MARILVVFGTRPEAIKMFPVVHQLRATEGIETLVAVTAQHRELLDQVLDIAGILPDVDLDLMRPSQSLDELSSRILLSFGKVLDDLQPDRVLVHGDTLTTMVVSLSAYFRKIPVGHVEAGLDVGMAFECGVHAAVQWAELSGIEADQVRTKFAQARAHTGGRGGEIGRNKGANLAKTGEADIGFQRNHGGVKHFDGLATGPLVAAFVQGQVHLINGDAGELHRLSAEMRVPSEFQDSRLTGAPSLKEVLMLRLPFS